MRRYTYEHRVEALRLAALGLTKVDIASRMDVPKSTVREWLNGINTKRPKKVVVKQLLSANGHLWPSLVWEETRA